MGYMTGIPALDEVIHGLRSGDSVVWKVDQVEDYAALVGPLTTAALDQGQRVLYFRFGSHERLIPHGLGARCVPADPALGFEQLITQIHSHLRSSDARPTAVVFDLLTDLTEVFSERMVGNFFRLTCPRIRISGSVAYFGLVRNYHSFHAVGPISETAQVLIDVYQHEGRRYLHPLKVEQRYSPSMYRLHLWQDGRCVPIPDSTTTTKVVKSTTWPGLRSASYRMIGIWDRRFIQAESLLAAHRRGEASQTDVEATFDRLSRALLSHDDRILALVRRYLRLEDLIDTWKHVIGSGMIGGKAVGLLLARAILRHEDPDLERSLEPHDSFFIGTEVFYSFLVDNDCWRFREQQKRPASLLDGIGEARGRILRGQFPDYLVKRFADLVDYYGQSPIVVRSSSLLEDAFGNAYAGKYESVFCANQGPHARRLDDFIDAVRIVYASTLSEAALLYRAKCGALDRDEQMALLVQRVSGDHHGDVFYPLLAGVGFSYNPFVWHPSIDPDAGVVRLVFGLGTRAVDRHDDDYTRIVAVNAPALRPESTREEAGQYRQRRVDYIDLNLGEVASDYFGDVVARSAGLPVERCVAWACDPEGRSRGSWELDLDRVVEGSTLVEELGRTMRVLRRAYGCHVDIEFSAHITSAGLPCINLLQCRPLQIKGSSATVELPASAPGREVLLEMRGPVLGASRQLEVGRLVYVVGEEYGTLPTQQRHAVARTIGFIAHAVDTADSRGLMLLGPGRWGTRLPQLGVPVTFAEIDTATVLCEIETMRPGLAPDLSLGTHFFHELVELDLLYLGFAPDESGNFMARARLAQLPNQLTHHVPSAESLRSVLRVIEPPAGSRLLLTADQPNQRASLILSRS